MELDHLKKQLQPCDLEHPYVFISYSSQDRLTVWQDALELQNRGYNIWIDEVNLDKTKPSWQEDALRAIEDYNCALVLFYISRGSLVSEPCYRELVQTTAEATQELHFGPVPFAVVEAEPVGDLTQFVQFLRDQVNRGCQTKEQKSKQAQTLFRFCNNFFPDNNRVRVVARTNTSRVGDYYTDLENLLKTRCAGTRFGVEKRYRRAVDFMIRGEFAFAEGHLNACVHQRYLPAQLMLGHIYISGIADGIQSTVGALAMWEEAEQQEPAARWKALGQEKLKTRFYSEALAFLLAAADRFEDPDCHFEASKLWTKKGCRALALEQLRIAQRLGDPRAGRFLSQLQAWSEDMVRSGALKMNDEAPIQ